MPQRSTTKGCVGHSDAEIAQVCQREARVLVTMDLDFADIRAYPPQDYEQPPRSTRRNALPVQRIDGSFLMGHTYLACAVV
jgi:hypothetical protein